MSRTSAALAALGLLLATPAIAQESDAQETASEGGEETDSPPAKPLPPRPVGIAPT